MPPTSNLVRCPDCNGEVSIHAAACPHCGRLTSAVGGGTPKRILPAFLLCLFFGGLGVHRFYCGKPVSGFLMLVFGIAGLIETLNEHQDNKAVGVLLLLILGIWLLVDIIRIIVGAMTDGKKRKITKWT